MDFEARLLIKREFPHHAAVQTLRFEAVDWDEAHEIAPSLTLPQGYSAYKVDQVVALERLM